MNGLLGACSSLCAFSGSEEPWYHQNVSSLCEGAVSRSSVCLVPSTWVSSVFELSEHVKDALRIIRELKAEMVGFMSSWRIKVKEQ